MLYLLNLFHLKRCTSVYEFNSVRRIKWEERCTPVEHAYFSYSIFDILYASWMFSYSQQTRSWKVQALQISLQYENIIPSILLNSDCYKRYYMYMITFIWENWYGSNWTSRKTNKDYAKSTGIKTKLARRILIQTNTKFNQYPLSCFGVRTCGLPGKTCSHMSSLRTKKYNRG
jgi:hypothetical protein